MSKKFYTVKQVAEALGFSTNTVYKYLDEGKIQATRLGTEGRFRISEIELLRLLDTKNTSPEQITEVPAVMQNVPESFISSSQNPGTEKKPEEEVSEASFKDDAGLLDKISNPSIFDWFIACLALFVGLSYFLFPYYTQNISYEPYALFNQVSKFSLIILAFVLLAADIFAHKNKVLKIAINSLLGILFIALAIPVFYTGNYLNVLGNGVVGVFILIFIILKLNDFEKFSLIILTLAFLSGAMFLINPAFFPDLGFSQMISDNLPIFGIFWFISFFTILIGALWGYFKSGKILIASFIFLGLGSFIYAVIATSEGFWEQGVYAIIMGSFSFIFPFWKRFESFAKYSKKELLEGFIWFFVVLIAGISLIIYVQGSFIDIALKENKRALETAKSITSAYLSQSQEDVSRFGANKRLLAFIKDPLKNQADLDSIASEFYSNTTVLRRVLIIDSEGKGISVYPEDNTFLGLSFSDRDYFFLAKSTKRIVVSEALKPRFGIESRVIAISFPLLDENGKFLGVIAGSIDFVKLGSKLNEIKFGTNGEFVIADNQKRIIIHPKSSFLLKPVEAGGALDMAVSGKTGSSQSYDEDGTLSVKTFAPLSAYGWGIKAQQPLGNLIIRNSRTSFLIFIVTIISGIGSLISALCFKKK